MARGAQAAGNGGIGGGWLIIAAVMAATLAVVALPLSVLFMAGMLPTLVAAIVDRHRLRYLTVCVGLLNLAGMVMPVSALLKLEMNLAAALHVLGDQRNWLIMYSAAGIGWVIYMAMPVVARVIVDLRAERLEHRLIRRAEALVAEWGAGLNRN